MVDLFRIRDHVPDFDALVDDIVARSAATRATLPMLGNVPYGSGPAETLDLFFPSDNCSDRPVHLFIHGGYWRRFSKRDYSCVAETVTAAGAIAAIVDYALMPEVRMATIVDQVRRAAWWIAGNIAMHGGNPDRLTVSGHSAGAHLSTFLFDADMDCPRLRAAFLLGGLYDLAPLTASFLQDEIALSDEEIATFSPVRRRHDIGTAVTCLAGADETAPFHQQADQFAAHLRRQGSVVERFDLAATDHMSSVRDLAVPGTQAADALGAFITRY